MKKKAAYILAMCLMFCAAAVLLSACGTKAPFSGTVYVDYITPEDSIYDNEQTLEGDAARLIRDAYDGVVDGVVPAGAPDVNVDLRRRESFGRVTGEPKADAELVLAPKMDPGSGEVDMEALVRDIALCVGQAKGVEPEVISAIGGGGGQTAKSTAAATTTAAPKATGTEAVPGTDAADKTGAPNAGVTTTVAKSTTQTTKAETTKGAQAFPASFTLTAEEEKRAEEQMRVFANKDIYDKQGNPIAYGPLVYDLKNDQGSGKAGKIAVWLEPYNGSKAVAHIYGKKPGGKEYTKIVRTEQAAVSVAEMTGNPNDDPMKGAHINIMYGELDNKAYRKGLSVYYSFEYKKIDIFQGGNSAMFNTKRLADYSDGDRSLYDISSWFPAG